jgi:hypothetical protein
MFNASEIDCTANTGLVDFISTCKIVNGPPVNNIVTIDYNQQQQRILSSNLNDNNLICDFTNSIHQFNDNVSTSVSSCSDASFHATSMQLATANPTKDNNKPNGNTPATNSKKFNKKKAQVTNEVDEERTSQLVLELLKNIKEKTKELENMNQNVKSNKTPSTPNHQSSSSATMGQSNSQYLNVSHSPASPHSLMASSASSPPTTTTTTPIAHSHQPSSNMQTIKKVKRLANKNFHVHPQINANILTTANKHTNRQTRSHNDKYNSDMHDSIANSEQSITHVPSGWKRTIDENGLVFYSSPSGVSLRSKSEIHTYLLSANTCKCGLNCPLDIDKTFSFDSKITAVNCVLSANNNSCCAHKLKFNGVNGCESGKPGKLRDFYE